MNGIFGELNAHFLATDAVLEGLDSLSLVEQLDVHSNLHELTRVTL